MDDEAVLELMLRPWAAHVSCSDSRELEVHLSKKQRRAEQPCHHSASSGTSDAVKRGKAEAEREDITSQENNFDFWGERKKYFSANGHTGI
eukprot:6301232-Amphidinium_carterae.1